MSATLAAARAPTTTGYAWYVVGVLVLAQACSFLDRMIMGLLVGPIRDTFQISDTQFSLLAGLAFSLFYAFMGLPLARIADAKSRRTLIGAGIAVWSAMTALCGLARGYWTLFLARVGVGVGEATLGPAAFSLITDYFPRHLLARALSVYMIGVTLGSGAAYMVGGAVVSYVEQLGEIVVPVIGAMHGWQLTFFLIGLPGLAVAVLFVLTVREPTRRGVAAGASEIPVADVIAFVWQRRRAYGAHMLGVSIFVMVVYALNLWGPSYLIRVFGYGRAEAGLTMGIVMIGAGTAGLMIGGTLADALASRGIGNAYVKTILGSVIAMIPFVTALGFIDTPMLGIAALSMAVLFSAFQGGIAGGALQLMTPNQMRGQVLAVYLLLANLIGLGAGPTVVAVITDYVFGYDAAIGKSIALAGGVLCPLAALVLWRGLPAIEGQLAEAAQWDD